MNRLPWVLALVFLVLATVNSGKAADMTNLLFLHHSCGGQLLADAGAETPQPGQARETCLYLAHPNGGGLRASLANAGFQVNEASYGSAVGQDTDICHWQRKFRDQMDVVLRTRLQDELLPDGQTNAIVAFKSCYPNNGFTGVGSEPGDADSCERTLANAKAAYRALLPAFAQHPDVLFVAFTAPPLAEPKPAGVMAKLKSLFGKKPTADLAQQFNTWLAEEWLATDRPRNVVVFDYYRALAGPDGWSAYPTRDGHDSHPSTDGNRQAAGAFIPFLTDSWRTFQSGS